jgi:hypothetical protein
MLEYFVTFSLILRPFDIVYAHLVYYVVIWYISPLLVCCSNKKSGNHAGKDDIFTG